jgi:hypothetical protein
MQQLPPPGRCKTPKIVFRLVEPKESAAICEDYSTWFYYPQSILETKLDFAKERKSAWHQNTIVSFGLQDIFGMSKIAEKSTLTSRIYVKRMRGSQVVSEPVGVRAPVDFENVSRNVGTMPFEEPVHIISINRSAAIPSMVVRERLQPTQIPPSGKS